MYSTEFAKDPHAVIREVRAESPIASSERGIELLSYSLCEQVLRDPRFAVGFDEMMEATGITAGPAHEVIVNSINNTEGEHHRRLRQAIAPHLAPRAVEELRARLREVVESRLAEVEADGECDLVETLTQWLPATAFCLLTGAPLADRQLIGELSDKAQRFFEMKPLNREDVEAGLADVEAYMDELLVARERDPGDDVISGLLLSERNGELTRNEARNLSIILLAASTDTTSGQITFTFAALADDPEAFRQLRANDNLAKNAVLETARYSPGLWTAPRFAREGGEIEGHAIEPGTQLNAFFLAANRDPEVFEEPDELKIERKLPRPPLNWSSGRHFCPGRPLAVLEIEEAVRAVARRWRRMRLLGPIESRGAPYIVAPTKAPIGFEPEGEVAT